MGRLTRGTDAVQVRRNEQLKRRGGDLAEPLFRDSKGLLTLRLSEFFDTGPDGLTLTVPVVESLDAETAQETSYAPVREDWTSPPPEDVQEALSRLAVSVGLALGALPGPILPPVPGPGPPSSSDVFVFEFIQQNQTVNIALGRQMSVHGGVLVNQGTVNQDGSLYVLS